MIYLSANIFLCKKTVIFSLWHLSTTPRIISHDPRNLIMSSPSEMTYHAILRYAMCYIHLSEATTHMSLHCYPLLQVDLSMIGAHSPGN